MIVDEQKCSKWYYNEVKQLKISYALLLKNKTKTKLNLVNNRISIRMSYLDDLDDISLEKNKTKDKNV